MKYLGYIDDFIVFKNSLILMFVVVVLFIDNVRWDGVFFFMKVGKVFYNKRWVKGKE